MIVQENSKAQKNIFPTTLSKTKELINFGRFVWERLCFLPFEASKQLRFAFSLANTGEDISKVSQIKEADIIHLHWFNQGYLSLTDLQKLFNLGKPLVWTMHDMWAFTGGCHYAGDCPNYKKKCGNCYYLKKPHQTDLSYRLHTKKEKLYKNIPLVLVGCSEWMAEKARESSLFKDFRIESIPNPIDTDLFSKKDKKHAREVLDLPIDKKIILFGAANILDRRKGIDYLLKSIDFFVKKYPYLAANIHCVVFGKAKSPIFPAIQSTHFSYINSSEQLVNLYSASDVFILPSVEDNLPNTVMESLACSVPVIAFKTGGLPEMVDHLKNGYLAPLYDVSNMAEGIKHILFDADHTLLQANARIKVLENYHPDIIAKKFINLYNDLLKK